MSDETLEEKLAEWRKRGAPGLLRRKGTTNTTPVVADDGERRGKVVGTQTEHWNDRVDANVFAPTIALTKDGFNGNQQ